MNITGSGNTSDSGNSSSQRPARVGRDPNRLVQRLNLKMHQQQQGAQRGSESGDEQTRRAARLAMAQGVRSAPWRRKRRQPAVAMERRVRSKCKRR
ncbi:hypothetical protein JOS77_09160 [Chromobacterium haemolyticum]|nr:hypothetical protein JOS77_09160 [Chromobacterium haemolyticum]